MTTSWNASDYQTHAAYVPAMGRTVSSWLNPQPGERILDLGCGDGTLTSHLVEAGAEVLAMDSSASMVNAAQARGLNVVQADGCRFSFRFRFDAVFSNAALHWMKQPDDVLNCIHRVLKPGGRFVAEFGGAGNVAVVHRLLLDEVRSGGHDAGAVDPWFFPTEEEYCRLLQQQGFRVVRMEREARPTPLPDVHDWLTTFAHPFLPWLKEPDAALTRIARKAESSLETRDGLVMMDYVRLRLMAVAGPPA